ncbi:hypothetical protein [Streptomyces lydicus]|uniref:hypothetical protein n=1 Tax=Streptomyces lydicus TaxID=47763 RepID=UPI0037CEB27A
MSAAARQPPPQHILHPTFRRSGFSGLHRERGGEMWSGRHDDYLEQAARMIAEELQRSRSRERAKAVKFSRQQVAQSRKIAHEVQAVELERLAALGQIPQAEYKARKTALEAGVEEGNGRIEDLYAAWMRHRLRGD